MTIRPIAAMELIRIGAASRIPNERTATTRRRAERGQLDYIRTQDGEYLFYATDVTALAARLGAASPRRTKQVPA